MYVIRQTPDGQQIDPNQAPKDAQLVATFLRSYTAQPLVNKDAGWFGRTLKAAVLTLSNWLNGTAYFGLGAGGPRVLKCRDGVLNGARVEYFKGAKMVQALLSKDYYAYYHRHAMGKLAESEFSVLPASTNAADMLVRQLMDYNFYFRVETVKEPQSADE